MDARNWMRSNLTTQGYCLSDAQRRDLWLGLRFSTGLCLSLVIVALALESAAMVFALCTIGAIASFAARHPFDYLWNRGVRHLVGGPALPPNPPRRRDAFKVATAWLAVVGTLFCRRRDHGRARARRPAGRSMRDGDRHQPVPAVGDVRVVGAPKRAKRSDRDMSRNGRVRAHELGTSSVRERPDPRRSAAG